MKIYVAVHIGLLRAASRPYTRKHNAIEWVDKQPLPHHYRVVEYDLMVLPGKVVYGG